jgi:hypothetical protein
MMARYTSRIRIDLHTRTMSQRVQLVFSGGIGFGAYQAGVYEAVDLSRASLEGRWRAGFLDMQEALQRFDARDHGEMLAVVRRAE